MDWLNFAPGKHTCISPWRPWWWSSPCPWDRSNYRYNLCSSEPYHGILLYTFLLLFHHHLILAPSFPTSWESKPNLLHNQIVSLHPGSPPKDWSKAPASDKSLTLAKCRHLVETTVGCSRSESLAHNCFIHAPGCTQHGLPYPTSCTVTSQASCGYSSQGKAGAKSGHLYFRQVEWESGQGHPGLPTDITCPHL